MALISDGLLMGFSSSLIIGYQKQLMILQTETEREKVKRKEWRALK